MKIQRTMLATLSVAVLALSTTAAFAQDKVGFYGRIDTGWSFSDTEGMDDTWIVSGGLGYRFTPNIRSDVTLGYRNYDISAREIISGTSVGVSTDATSWAGLINVYYDFTNSSRFTPYLGAGLGLSHNTIDDTKITVGGANAGSRTGDSITSFAWQLSAGTAIRISSGINLDVGYRYVDLGKAETGDTAVISGVAVSGVRDSDDLRAHEFQIGIRFDF